MNEPDPFASLVELCARLRAPDGCPWDRQQDMDTLRTYVLEEAHEVADALGRNDRSGLLSELGDLLFQVVFVAELARERGWFDMDDVCRAVHAKMVRRHPHVFGQTVVAGADEVVRNWEAIKQGERGDRGALAGVPPHLPALLKALRITEKAAALGFDWERIDDIVAKLKEEVGELEVELAGDAPAAAVRAEFGDVLFALANIGRRLRIDPESALQDANAKFTRRFGAMEAVASERGRSLGTMTLDELEELWQEVKAGERDGV